MSNFKIKTRERKKNDRVRDGLANLTTVHNTQSINQLAETKKNTKKKQRNTSFSLRLWGDLTLGYFPVWSQRESDATTTKKKVRGAFMAVRNILFRVGVRYEGAA